MHPNTPNNVMHQVDFASYGQPGGACGAFEHATGCHASAARAALTSLCVNQTACMVDMAAVAPEEGAADMAKCNVDEPQRLYVQVRRWMCVVGVASCVCWRLSPSSHPPARALPFLSRTASSFPAPIFFCEIRDNSYLTFRSFVLGLGRYSFGLVACSRA